MIRIAMADDDEVFLKKIEKYVEKYQGRTWGRNRDDFVF